MVWCIRSGQTCTIILQAYPLMDITIKTKSVYIIPPKTTPHICCPSSKPHEHKIASTMCQLSTHRSVKLQIFSPQSPGCCSLWHLLHLQDLQLDIDHVTLIPDEEGLVSRRCVENPGVVRMCCFDSINKDTGIYPGRVGLVQLFLKSTKSETCC